MWCRGYAIAFTAEIPRCYHAVGVKVERLLQPRSRSTESKSGHCSCNMDTSFSCSTITRSELSCKETQFHASLHGPAGLSRLARSHRAVIQKSLANAVFEFKSSACWLPRVGHFGECLPNLRMVVGSNDHCQIFSYSKADRSRTSKIFMGMA